MATSPIFLSSPSYFSLLLSYFLRIFFLRIGGISYLLLVSCQEIIAPGYVYSLQTQTSCGRELLPSPQLPYLNISFPEAIHHCSEIWDRDQGPSDTLSFGRYLQVTAGSSSQENGFRLTPCYYCSLQSRFASFLSLHQREDFENLGKCGRNLGGLR